MADRNTTEKVIIGYRVSAVIIGSSTLVNFDEKSYHECLKRSLKYDSTTNIRDPFWGNVPKIEKTTIEIRLKVGNNSSYF